MCHRVPFELGSCPPIRPDGDGFAEDAGELVRALAEAESDVVVCAVGRPGLNYPDEVVAVVATDELADYRRAGRVLAEHGVDTVLIRHDDGDLSAARKAPTSSTCAQELRRQGMPLAVSLHTVRRDARPTWSRTVAALTAGRRG